MTSFRKKSFYSRPKLLGTALTLAVNHAALAAPQLEEVIVTAQKRSENLQDVPVAVSAAAERLGVGLAPSSIPDAGWVCAGVRCCVVSRGSDRRDG